ncbi:MAG TPA: hypothetical protein VM468_06600 [Mycoplana sp.]|nr:hypothetical protein [Mycoplana sp.]
MLTTRQEQDGQQWIRHYIRAKAEDGEVRVKTALRVAGALSNREKADLYQVVLLDEAGPAQRADMRGRAIGAEVLFSRDPGQIPGMSAPFAASYVEGPAAENGEFYGERRALEIDEIKSIVTAMSERADCLDLAATGGEGGHGTTASTDHAAPAADDQHASPEAGAEQEVAAAGH